MKKLRIKFLGVHCEEIPNDIIILDDDWFVYDGDVACVGILTPPPTSEIVTG